MKKNKSTLVIFLAGVIGLMLLAAYSSPWTRARKNINLSLREARISELSAAGLTLSFYLQLENNSNRNYGLVSYQYQVLINEKEYFRQSVSLDQPIGLPASQSSVINFPVKIYFEYLEPYLSGTRQQAACRIAGDMIFQDERMRTERVAFNFRADFPVFELPEIKLLPLLVRDLTLGGADFDFRFLISNPNSYDILIQKIKLELKLGGRLIYQGQLRGDKSLSAGQTRNFSIPLMLDFFEQGRELRDSLERESALFTLNLMVEADSAWGWLIFPLEATASVPKEFSR